MRRRLAAVLVSVLAPLASAGCGGGGGARDGGGTGGGFTGFGGFGGFGLVDGGGSTGTDGPPLQPAPPICGNGIVEATETCDGAAATACPANRRCGATCTCVAGPPPPSDSGSLIAQALAAGRIDTFTSLLYRAYLFAGDGRLPPEFDGDFTVAEDTALFLEVSRLWATLTPAQQQQLLPYVARPNDPASVYSTPPTAAYFGEPGDDGDDLLAAGDSDPIQCPPLAPTTAADFRYTASDHFVVWSCGSGDPATDPYAGKRQAVSALAEQVWSLEVPSMGAPRDDDFPFDPENKKRIDIYLVPLNKCIRRGPTAVCAALTSNKMIAAAVPDSPCDNSRGPLTSSGYALMRLDMVPDAAPAAAAAAKARSDFAHELFHLLTYGLNLDAQGGGCRNRQFTGAVAGRTSWLTEASATWAEWAYTPTDNPEYRADKFDGYQQRIPSADSLLDTNLVANPAYEAFVYPLFLSQESGNRMSFEDFWKTARTARTREALDDHLNTRFSFARHFRDFAVKMLNTSLPGSPLSPLLSTFDSAVPPDFPPSNILPAVDLPELDSDLPFHTTLAPLAAQYQQLIVPEGTRWVDIDLSGAGADLTMDVIVNVDDQWSRRPVNGLRFTFCRDDAPDDIKELWVVVANTAHTDGAKADEDYKVKVRKSCPASITGWIEAKSTVSKHAVENDETVDQFEQVRETWTLGMEHPITFGVSQSPGIDAHWHATFVHHESSVRAACQYSTTDGEGGGSHVSPWLIQEPGGGALVLSATGSDPGSFDVPMVIHYEMCDGNSATITDDRTVYESGPLVSAYVQLTPQPGNPSRFSGSKVVSHSEQPLNGGTSLVDFVISWDITRTRR